MLTPATLSTQYSLQLNASHGLDAGAVLYKAPAGFIVGQGCPSFSPGNGMCLGADKPIMQYLDPASTYLLVVDAALGAHENDELSAVDRHEARANFCVPLRRATRLRGTSRTGATATTRTPPRTPGRRRSRTTGSTRTATPPT